MYLFSTIIAILNIILPLLGIIPIIKLINKRIKNFENEKCFQLGLVDFKFFIILLIFYIIPILCIFPALLSEYTNNYLLISGLFNMLFIVIIGTYMCYMLIKNYKKFQTIRENNKTSNIIVGILCAIMAIIFLLNILNSL